eukprot:3056454-Karenia_brevis.AAC.1
MPPMSLDAKVAMKYSSYDARRALPTMGGIVGLSALEKASLDDWKDYTGGNESRRVAASCGICYDGAKLIATAKIKMEL